jgi:hypothetical protein
MATRSFGAPFGGLGLRLCEMRCESRQHSRVESTHDSEHELVLAPVLDEGPQLILQVLRLLSGEPWNGN